MRLTASEVKVLTCPKWKGKTKIISVIDDEGHANCRLRIEPLLEGIR